MDKLPDAIITASITLGGGVLLMVATQLFTRLVAEPLADFRRVIGEIAYTLILYSNVLFNPNAFIAPRSVMTALTPRDRWDEATEDCRKLSGRLIASSAAVPLYGLFVDLGMIPELDKVYEASKALTGLSNSRRGDPDQVAFARRHYDTVSKCLRIRVE